MKIFQEGVPSPIEFFGQGYIWEPVPAPSLISVFRNSDGLFKENKLWENFTGLQITRLKPGEKVKLIDIDGNETIYKVKVNENDGLRLKAVRFGK